VLCIYVYLGVGIVYSEYDACLALSKEKCKYLSTFGLACSTRVVEVRIVLLDKAYKNNMQQHGRSNRKYKIQF